MTNDLKLKIYPAIIAILGLSLVALLLSRIQIQIASNAPEPVLPLPAEPEVPPAPEIPPPSQPEPIAETPTASPIPPAAVVPSPIANSELGNLQGGLRVSNQTPFPIRLALLPQVQDEVTTTYRQPVHWDFAPEEGKTKGLILSLPDRTLSLQAGDVLVAFAQDGSRRYWGPYVVGQTLLPNWRAEQKEWWLILQP
ncbi:MAG: hypothetical protein MUF72_12225 [Elainella sp. Prado103]|nr:hypothetical protein [Elainella sp. Prado103]